MVPFSVQKLKTNYKCEKKIMISNIKVLLDIQLFKWIINFNYQQWTKK